MKTQKLHRNSQKRFYIPGVSYFITGVTKKRPPYFEEEIFCEIFAENLKLCQRLKNFDLHAWFLGYDHFHLLMTPKGEWNISKIMQNIKRTSLLKINQIAEPKEGENIYSRLLWDDQLTHWKNRFHEKHPNTNLLPKFKWQPSFHDHVIRNEQDFLNHMNYIHSSPIKHNLPEEWKWVFFRYGYRALME